MNNQNNQQPQQNQKKQGGQEGFSPEQLSQMTQILVEATKSMNDSDKRKLRDALEVGKAVKQVKRKNPPQATQNMVRAFGDVVREDPDFLPVPPDPVVEAGQAAIDRWHERWENNISGGVRYLDDEVAASASA